MERNHDGERSRRPQAEFTHISSIVDTVFAQLHRDAEPRAGRRDRKRPRPTVRVGKQTARRQYAWHR